jgi:hypothetical protein
MQYGDTCIMYIRKLKEQSHEIIFPQGLGIIFKMNRALVLTFLKAFLNINRMYMLCKLDNFPSLVKIL